MTANRPDRRASNDSAGDAPAPEPPSIDALLKDSDWDTRLAEARLRRQAVLAAREAASAGAAASPPADPTSPRARGEAPPVAPEARHAPARATGAARRARAGWLAAGLLIGVGAGLGAPYLPQLAGLPIKPALPGAIGAPSHAAQAPAQPDGAAAAPEPVPMSGVLPDSAPRPAGAAGPARPGPAARVERAARPPRPGAMTARHAAPPRLQAVVPGLTGPVAPGRIALTLTHADATRAAALDRVTGTLRAAGFAVPAPVAAMAGPGASELRFFHTADADAARAAGFLTGVAVRDYTTFRPRPPRGALALWLAPG